MRLLAGCDVGSTTTKAVVIDEHGAVVAQHILPSGMDPEITARSALESALQGLDGPPTLQQLDRIVGTGYGRIELSFVHDNISEITCHAVGAHVLHDTIRTVIDVGGQDCKAISLASDGHVLDFAMNDKCAAGTGRFFEAMSRSLQTSLETFSLLSLESQNPLPISSQCSVFAESEVVSLISQRRPPADIAAGVQRAVAKRVMALARRVGIVEQVTVTGGCAKNVGLIRAMEFAMKGVRVTPLSFDAQLVGALGAAEMARRQVQS